MKITFLGGGNMATALIDGLINNGFLAGDIAVIELDVENRERLSKDFDVRCHSGPDAEALNCDVLLLAVKPQQMREACAPLQGGLSGSSWSSALLPAYVWQIFRVGWGGYTKLVRTMPDMPAQIDPVTAISGSSPAYVFLFIEALQKAAADLGFSSKQAHQLSIETVLGAARLASHSEETAGVLRERVTSKGEATPAALDVMAERGVMDGITAGVLAANARGIELGESLGKD